MKKYRWQANPAEQAADQSREIILLLPLDAGGCQRLCRRHGLYFHERFRNPVSYTHLTLPTIYSV